MDSRLKVYLVLTTFNSLVDLVFQEEFVPLTVYFICRVLVLTWLLLATPTNTTKATTTTSAPSSHWQKMMMMVGAHQAMGIFLLLNTAYWVYRSPAIWDSNQWALQSDLVVGVWMMAHTMAPVDDEASHRMTILASTISLMYAQYYLAAGFFKINTHFLDPDASCATVFAVQHISYYIGPFLSHSTLVAICATIKPLAPVLTLAIELSMGGCFAWGQGWWWNTSQQERHWTRRGLMLILYFHLAVCLTPEPLDISMFALQCACRLVMALEPHSLERVWQRHVLAHWGSLAAVACVWVAYGVQTSFTPLNWSFAAFVPVLVLHTLAVREEGSSCSSSAALETEAETTQQHKERPLWSWAAIGMAWFYAFGTIILGLMEEASCNMFANLKIHGGSNHLLVPTGLLLDGPIVRIQSTDSTWLTQIYPADFSHIVQPPVTASVLEAIGNPRPFYFNSGANRVLGLFRKGWVPHNGVFVPYTIPAMEFRRLFTEARQYDGAFTLEYAELPGRAGDEEWRASAVARTVQVTVREGQIQQCRVMGGGGPACNNSTSGGGHQDLVYQPFTDIPWVRRQFSMYHGYPIVYRPDGTVRPSIACFGP